MHTKSKRVLAASALALAAAGGASVALVRLTAAPGTTVVSPAALPSAAGQPTTATVPRGPGGADGNGAASVASGVPAAGGTTPSGGGTAAPSSGGSTGSASPGPVSSSAAAGSATQAASAVPADGAVPGASPALTSLAAARAATTVLPHSPQLLAALAGKVPAAPAAASAAAPKTLGGLDVAAFQHPNGKGIAWRSVAAAHYTFAAVKATEGNYYVSPYAASDLAGARAAGLDATPYHFAIPNASDGATQARFAVQHSGYRSGARLLPLMLDIEYDPYVNTDRTNECYGLSAASMRTWLSAFVSTAKSLTGQFPLIYTTADWWNTCTGRSTAFAADPMWVAAYGTSSPPLPAGWKSWTFWQYSSGGTVPGVYAAGATDVDRFTPTAVGLINPGTETLRRGKLASLTISSLGKLAGEKLTYAAAGLPPGVTLRAGGVLAGTVAKSASKATVTYHVTVSARNASGGTGSVVFSWNVAPA